MDEERDSHGRTHEDYLADEADRKRKIAKEEDGLYEAWSKRLEDQAAYERDKRLLGDVPVEDVDGALMWRVGGGEGWCQSSN